MNLKFTTFLLAIFVFITNLNAFTPPAPPSNDDPCNAIDVGLLTVGSPKLITGTNVGATNSVYYTSDPTSQRYDDRVYHVSDVWFKFKLPAGYYSGKVVLTTTSGKKFTINQYSKHACGDQTMLTDDMQPTGNYFTNTNAIASTANQELSSIRTFNDCKYSYSSGSYVPGDYVYVFVGGVTSADQGAFTLTFQTYGLSGGGCGGCKMKTASITTCDCEFTDSQGNGTNYNPSENFTYTVCPDSPGKKVKVAFSEFRTKTNDVLKIYDGNSATGAAIITAQGISPSQIIGSGIEIKASTANTSGCLTFKFTSDSGFGDAEDKGWVAQISCFTPCTLPVSKAVTTPLAVANTVKICKGTKVDFNGSSSLSNAASISKYEWDFDDGGAKVVGANVSYTYTKAGRYLPKLTVTNSDGCVSTNDIQLEILVPNSAIFKGTTANQTACLGKEVCLLGAVTYPVFVDKIEVPPTGTVTLPDGAGKIYETKVQVSGYDLGKKITSASDLASLCLNMEHSAIDDLIITLISPDGKIVKLHNRGGENAFLGFPVLESSSSSNGVGCPGKLSGVTETTSDPGGAGKGLDYCFNSTATVLLKSKASNTPFDCDQIPAGTYKPVDLFSALIGADINGAWTLRIEDASAKDNGFLFSWALNFNPSLLPANATIAPKKITEAWTGPATITSNVGNKICAKPTTIGANSYVYSVTDDFGCKADTTIKITVTAGPTVTVNSPSVCSGASATVTATPNPSGTYTYAWTVPATATAQTTASFSTLVAGDYSVVITNASGCSSCNCK